MPLTGTGTALGDSIVAAIESANPGMTPAQISQLKSTWEPVASAIVAHIVANAVVLPGSFNNPAGQAVQVAVPSGTGATSAPEPIAGTGTIE